MWRKNAFQQDYKVQSCQPVCKALYKMSQEISNIAVTAENENSEYQVA